MADFAPPPGPPPPKVPEGWKAVFNPQYNEWFFVNIYTKKSQWEKPETPVHPPTEGSSSADHPPAYDPTNPSAQPLQNEKTGASTGERMFGGPGGSSGKTDMSADEDLARRLQAEEDARHGGAGSRGEADGYYAQQGGPSQYGQQPSYDQGQVQQDSRGKSKGGFLSKILGKAGNRTSTHAPPGYPPPGQQAYGQQGYGYPPQQGYYGGGGYPQQAGRRPGGGLGAGGGAALGLGGGLLGGMLIGDAMGHAGDGGDGGGDGGGYGGDDGGGDGGGFGGDDGGGGGDFGGGDMGGGDF